MHHNNHCFSGSQHLKNIMKALMLYFVTIFKSYTFPDKNQTKVWENWANKFGLCFSFDHHQRLHCKNVRKKLKITYLAS